MGRLCPTTSVDPGSVGLYDDRMLPPEEIGRRVRQVREETRLAPGEVAERSGIPLPEYEQLETGQLSPLPGDYVLLVADALDKDFKFFISTDLDKEEEQTREIYPLDPVPWRRSESRKNSRRHHHWLSAPAAALCRLSSPSIRLSVNEPATSTRTFVPAGRA